MNAQPSKSYEEKFQSLWTELSKDAAAMKKFQENPTPVLHAAGIPVMQSISPSTKTSEGHPVSVNLEPLAAAVSLVSLPALEAAEGEHVSASSKWWGVDVTMNEKLTQDIISGISGAGPVGAAVAAAFAFAGIVTAGVASVIGGAIGAICAVKVAEIKIIDNGNGVHWPITWVQWALLIAALPGGPANVVLAGMAFLHPLRN